MRTLLLLLLPLHLFAQDWKEQYVTITGDTIRIGTTIKISSSAPLNNVAPSPYDVSGTPFDNARNERNHRYVIAYMAGNTFKIDKLTRIKTGNKYTAVAVLVIGDKSMSLTNNTPFNIYIDKALANKEIEIIKPQ